MAKVCFSLTDENSYNSTRLRFTNEISQQADTGRVLELSNLAYGERWGGEKTRRWQDDFAGVLVALYASEVRDGVAFWGRKYSMFSYFVV